MRLWCWRVVCGRSGNGVARAAEDRPGGESVGMPASDPRGSGPLVGGVAGLRVVEPVRHGRGAWDRRDVAERGSATRDQPGCTGGTGLPRPVPDGEFVEARRPVAIRNWPKGRGPTPACEPSDGSGGMLTGLARSEVCRALAGAGGHGRGADPLPPAGPWPRRADQAVGGARCIPSRVSGTDPTCAPRTRTVAAAFRRSSQEDGRSAWRHAAGLAEKTDKR
jgi:hypothetical protein